MKNCPYCGQQNSDEVRFCGQCGKEISSIKETGSTTQEEKQAETVKPSDRKRRNLIVIFSIAVFAIIVCAVIYSNPKLLLNEEEKMAVEAITLVKERLLKPESIRLYAVSCYQNEDNIYQFVIDYGADNRGGGITEASALIRFENSECKIQATTDDNETETEKKIAYALIEYVRSSGYTLDTEKIEKAIK